MRVLVLGIGNILFGDEGIGVHLCNFLKVNYEFHSLDFIDSKKGENIESSLQDSKNFMESKPQDSKITESKKEKNTIEFIDGGTLANMLIPLIIEYDNVLILDCVSVDNAAVGEVYSFSFDKIPSCITWAGSAHEVEMLQTLHLTHLMGDLPSVQIIGIVPEVIGEDTAFTLSEALLKGAITMQNAALKYIESLGFKITQKNNIPLQEIANNSYKGF